MTLHSTSICLWLKHTNCHPQINWNKENLIIHVSSISNHLFQLMLAIFELKNNACNLVTRFSFSKRKLSKNSNRTLMNTGSLRTNRDTWNSSLTFPINFWSPIDFHCESLISTTKWRIFLNFFSKKIYVSKRYTIYILNQLSLCEIISSIPPHNFFGLFSALRNFLHLVSRTS